MHNYSKKYKIRALAIVILSVLSGTVLFFDKNSFAQDIVVEGQQIGGDILAILNDLNKIKLDDSIFSDPVFVSLKDYSVTIPKELKGRQNPFLPIGSGGTIAPTKTPDVTASVATTTKTTTGTTTPVRK